MPRDDPGHDLIQKITRRIGEKLCNLNLLAAFDQADSISRASNGR
jgi:hypothetical protein